MAECRGLHAAQDRKKTPPTAQVGLARPRGLAGFRDTRLLEINGLVQKVFATKSAFSSANPRTPASGRRSPDASLCVAVGLTNAARTAVSLARDIAESCAELASSNDPRRRPRHRRSLLGFVLAIARGAISLDRRDGAAGPQPCHGQERDRKSTRLNSSHGYISYA